MAEVIPELSADISATEEHGELTEVTEGHRVKVNRTDIAALGLTGYVLGLSNLPQPSEVFNAQNPNLKVERREIDRVMSQDKFTITVHVLIMYALQRPTAAFSLEGGTTTVQVKTDVDINDDQITVSDGTLTKGVSIDVFEAQSSIGYETTETTNDPDTLVRQWVNYTNSADFRGEEIGTWRISDVKYSKADMSATPKTWHFTWSMLHKAKGWKPTAKFIDENLETPENLTQGEDATDGLRRVDVYNSRDFTAKFT